MIGMKKIDYGPKARAPSRFNTMARDSRVAGSRANVIKTVSVGMGRGAGAVVKSGHTHKKSG